MDDLDKSELLIVRFLHLDIEHVYVDGAKLSGTERFEEVDVGKHDESWQ